MICRPGGNSFSTLFSTSPSDSSRSSPSVTTICSCRSVGRWLPAIRCAGHLASRCPGRPPDLRLSNVHLGASGFAERWRGEGILFSQQRTQSKPAGYQQIKVGRNLLQLSWFVVFDARKPSADARDKYI